MLGTVRSKKHEAPLKTMRIGSVSFLNAKPLIHGLSACPELSLSLDVPSRLLDGLRGGRFDVALLPVIDYQRMAGLRLLTAGGIGCDGATLTVRIFSRTPIEQISTLACDTDSHTSVALAQIILHESFALTPRIIALDDPASDAAAARLLIGDKVVCDEPAGFAYQLDLGQAWKDLTGQPFVFAAWMAREGVLLDELSRKLTRAREQGTANIDQIIKEHAIPRGWPAGVARRYLTEYLKFEIGPRQVEAIRLFHAKLAAHALIEGPPRPLDVFEG